MITIICKLRAFIRADQPTNSFVGFIPSLKVFTQAKAEDRIKAALDSAAGCFIGYCYEQGILDDVLHEQGLTRAEKPETLEQADAENDEFIFIAQNFDRELELEIPLTLVAERQAAVACQ